MRGNNRWLRRSLLCLCCLALPVQAELTVYAWPREPLSYQDQDGTPKGLAVDILAALMEQAGEPYKLKFVPLNRALLSVEQKPEVCILLLERRQEREAQFSWIGPLLISRFSLYSAANNPLKLSGLDSAKAFRVLSHMGSGVGEYLQELGFTVDFSNHNGLNPDKLARQRAPLWATSEVSAQALSKQANVSAPYEVLPFITVMEALACNVRSDRIRQQRLQQTLLELYRSGQIQQLYQRYGVTLD